MSVAHPHPPPINNVAAGLHAALLAAPAHPCGGFSPSTGRPQRSYAGHRCADVETEGRSVLDVPNACAEGTWRAM